MISTNINLYMLKLRPKSFDLIHRQISTNVLLYTRCLVECHVEHRLPFCTELSVFVYFHCVC